MLVSMRQINDDDVLCAVFEQGSNVIRGLYQDRANEEQMKARRGS